MHLVSEAGLAFRHFEADRARSTGRLTFLDLLGAQRAADPVVDPPAPGSLRRLPFLLQQLRCAIAVVGAAVRDQSRAPLTVFLETLRLEVRGVRPSDIRSLVPVEAEPPQAVDDA